VGLTCGLQGPQGWRRLSRQVRARAFSWNISLAKLTFLSTVFRCIRRILRGNAQCTAGSCSFLPIESDMEVRRPAFLLSCTGGTCAEFR
jgi:hypothetical protein